MRFRSKTLSPDNMGSAVSSLAMLYPAADLIGWVLSTWRNRVVSAALPPGELLDLACGDNRLVALRGSGTGVDIHPYPNVDKVVKDICHLPFPDEAFDVVTIVASLHLFPEPIAALKEAKRVLKRDGVMVVTQLDKQVSSVWHKFKERVLPRPAYSEAELRPLVMQSGLLLAAKSSFMLGLNHVYTLRKSGSCHQDPE